VQPSIIDRPETEPRLSPWAAPLSLLVLGAGLVVSLLLYGMLLTLSPSTDFGASSKERLKRFYRRFGFVSNKGRQKDFTLFDSMYRLPKG